MNEKNKLKVYDDLRMFHKSFIGKYIDRKDLTEQEKNVIETLHGFLYMCESEILKETL